MFDSRHFFPPKKISPPKDTETPVESPIPISPSSSVGSSSPVRSTTPPPDYPFDKSIFAELDNSLWIIPQPLGTLVINTALYKLALASVRDNIVCNSFFAKWMRVTTVISMGHYAKGMQRIKEAKEDQFRNQEPHQDARKHRNLQGNVGIGRCKNQQKKINTLKTEFEKLKQEKDAIDFKIEKFGKASKDLDQLLGSQITDKSKKGHDEFKDPEYKAMNKNPQVKSSFVAVVGLTLVNVSKVRKKKEPKKVRENNDAPIIEEWVSDDEEQDESKTKPEKKTVIPTAAKIEKPVKKSVRYAEMYRSQSPRGNQRNWNGEKSNQLEKKETDIQEKDKKKAKNKQNQARNGKDKVKSKPKSVKVKKSTGKSTPKKSKVK
ncbi:hypothetical protein Tco_1243472 [Tanacetum coccineum]